MDFAQIASAVATTLAPFTPYLVEGGKKFAEKAGESAWVKAQALWDKIKTHFADDDPSVRGAVLMVSADPQNRTLQDQLGQVLAVRLQEKPALAEELVNLLGGMEAVQEVLADRDSLVKDVTQDMSGGGTQTVKASEKSEISGVRQIKR
ncbi:MAG: hypothetical protein P8173_14940 [Gammaproteobacteria bacterium]|jgi:hypothetical protein